MDETAARFLRLERKIRLLLVIVIALAGLSVAQMAGWVPAPRMSELRTERIVLSEADGRQRSVEISAKGIKLADEDEGTVTILRVPSGMGPSISVRGPEGWTELGRSGLRLSSKDGAVLELRASGASPSMVMLGGGQTDIAPGFVSVQGDAGVVAIDGRPPTLGLRILDAKGNAVTPPR